MIKVVSKNNIIPTPTDAQGFVNVLKCVPLHTKNIAVRVFDILPGGYTDLHTHGHVHINLVQYGTLGIFTTNRDKPTYTLKAGDFCSIDGNDKHRYKNVGTTPVRFICVTEAYAEPKPAL